MTIYFSDLLKSFDTFIQAYGYTDFSQEVQIEKYFMRFKSLDQSVYRPALETALKIRNERNHTR